MSQYAEWPVVSGGGGGGSPGGSSGSVQYNNAGAFGGFGSWNGSLLSFTGDQTITGNSKASNFVPGLSAQTGSGGTTVLSATSSRYQVVNAGSNQSYQLPDATTLSLGFTFDFQMATSSGSLIIKSHSGATLYTVPTGGAVRAVCRSISSANGTWDFKVMGPPGASWGTNLLNNPGGLVTGTIQNTAGSFLVDSAGAVNGKSYTLGLNTGPFIGGLSDTGSAILISSMYNAITLGASSLTLGQLIPDSIKIPNLTGNLLLSLDSSEVVTAVTLVGAANFNSPTLTVFPSVYSGIIYVDSNGNDSNPGTVEQPFQTIQAAYNAAVLSGATSIQLGAGVFGDIQVTDANGWPTGLSIRGVGRDVSKMGQIILTPPIAEVYNVSSATVYLYDCQVDAIHANGYNGFASFSVGVWGQADIGLNLTVLGSGARVLNAYTDGAAGASGTPDPTNYPDVDGGQGGNAGTFLVDNVDVGYVSSAGGAAGTPAGAGAPGVAGAASSIEARRSYLGFTAQITNGTQITVASNMLAPSYTSIGAVVDKGGNSQL